MAVLALAKWYMQKKKKRKRRKEKQNEWLLSKRLTRNYDDGPARSARARERGQRIGADRAFLSSLSRIPLFPPPHLLASSLVWTRETAARALSLLSPSSPSGVPQIQGGGVGIYRSS